MPRRQGLSYSATTPPRSCAGRVGQRCPERRVPSKSADADIDSPDPFGSETVRSYSITKACSRKLLKANSIFVTVDKSQAMSSRAPARRSLQPDPEHFG